MLCCVPFLILLFVSAAQSTTAEPQTWLTSSIVSSDHNASTSLWLLNSSLAWLRRYLHNDHIALLSVNDMTAFEFADVIRDTKIVHLHTTHGTPIQAYHYELSTHWYLNISTLHMTLLTWQPSVHTWDVNVHLAHNSENRWSVTSFYTSSLMHVNHANNANNANNANTHDLSVLRISYVYVSEYTVYTVHYITVRM